MVSLALMPPSTGLLLPESFLQSGLFSVLAAFVAINTVIYSALAVVKVLPKVYPSDWVTSRNRRAQSRSIYPDQQPATTLDAPSETSRPLDRVA